MAMGLDPAISHLPSTAEASEILKGEIQDLESNMDMFGISFLDIFGYFMICLDIFGYFFDNLDDFWLNVDDKQVHRHGVAHLEQKRTCHQVTSEGPKGVTG